MSKIKKNFFIKKIFNTFIIEIKVLKFSFNKNFNYSIKIQII